MSRLPILFLLALLSPLVWSQSIDVSQTGDHINQPATVIGKVSRVNTIPSGLTFINFETTGNGPRFSVVVRKDLTDAATLQSFEAKTVEVSGTITLYNDSPQILLDSPSDIRIHLDPSPGADSNPPPDPVPRAAPPEIKTFTVPLDRSEIRRAGKAPGGTAPEEASAASFTPRNFTPTDRQTILLVFPDFHSDRKMDELIQPYISLAAENNWVVLGARGPTLDFTLESIWHTVMFEAALRHLTPEYPGIAEWAYYLAGNGDGASRATLSTGALISEAYNVRGLYLTSLKREDLSKSIETFGPSKLKMKKLSIFISQGKSDPMTSGSDSLKAAESIREAGIQNVRYEVHDGRAGVDPASLATAVEWFKTTE